MNIIDSSFWLEYFAGTDAGDIVSDIVENTNELIIPTITLYEVFKKLLLERNEDDALLWTQDRHFSGLNSVNYFEK